LDKALKRERALFYAGVGLYRNPETAFERFVQTVEDLIATETTRYFPAEEQRLEKMAHVGSKVE
jgi:hypothetical protein